MSVAVFPEESAESEAAWKGLGNEVGLRIWRIVVSIVMAGTALYNIYSYSKYTCTLIWVSNVVKCRPI